MLCSRVKVESKAFIYLEDGAGNFLKLDLCLSKIETESLTLLL